MFLAPVPVPSRWMPYSFLIFYIYYRFASNNTCSGFPCNCFEDNGGSDGNSSVAELEQRVEALEEADADH